MSERLKEIIRDHLKEQAEIYLADTDCSEEHRKDAQRIMDAISGEGGGV